MSRMKNVHSLIATLREAADDLEAVFDDGLFYAPQETPTATVETQTETQTVTLEEVRAVLSEKKMAGHGEAVRALLTRHGASKLSEIAPAHYPAMLEEARAIT